MSRLTKSIENSQIEGLPQIPMEVRDAKAVQELWDAAKNLSIYDKAAINRFSDAIEAMRELCDKDDGDFDETD